MPPRIVLVEDNDSDVELIRTAFDEGGITCCLTVFSDGEAAMAGIQGIAETVPCLPPDLILLDLNLPRVSGHQVLTMIRLQPSLAAVPAVVLSTSNHGGDRQRCLANGAAEYLVKPPCFGEMLELVAGLQRRWLRSQA